MRTNLFTVTRKADCCPLGCDSVQFLREELTFRRNLPPSSSTFTALFYLEDGGIQQIIGTHPPNCTVKRLKAKKY